MGRGRLKRRNEKGAALRGRDGSGDGDVGGDRETRIGFVFMKRSRGGGASKRGAVLKCFLLKKTRGEERKGKGRIVSVLVSCVGWWWLRRWYVEGCVAPSSTNKRLRRHSSPTHDGMARS